MKNLLVLVAVLAGCSGGAPQVTLAGGWWRGATLYAPVRKIPYHIADNMVPWAEFVVDGAQAWASFGIDLVEDDATPYTVSCVKAGAIDGAGVANQANVEIDCDWMALPGATDTQRRQVLAHEFGHFIGLGHVEDDPEAVMTPVMPLAPTNAFTAADVANFEAVYGEVTHP